MTACLQNCASLEVLKLPMGADTFPSDDENLIGCLWGHSTLCRFQGMGEEVVLGGKAAVDQSYSRAIGVINLSANWANGLMFRGSFRWPKIAVTPAKAARVDAGTDCAKAEGACNIGDHRVHAQTLFFLLHFPHVRSQSLTSSSSIYLHFSGCVEDSAAEGTCNAELDAGQLSKTRKLYFPHDQGDMTARMWRLNEVSGAAQPKNCGSGSFWNHPAGPGVTTQCYQDPSKGDNTFTTKTIAYAGYFFGRSIVGPAIDMNAKWLYFIWCSGWRGSLSNQCNEYTLSRYGYDDASDHAGQTQHVYTAPRQLFPAPYPSAHYEGSFTMAVDPHPDRKRVYWYAAHQNSWSKGGLFSLSLKDWDGSPNQFAPRSVDTHHQFDSPS